MTEVFTMNLNGMPVTSTDGIRLGHLQSITADISTGILENIIIKSNSQEDIKNIGIERGGEETLQIPIDQVTAIDDHIIVDWEEELVREE